MRAPAAVLIAAALLGTAACSSTSVYTADQACSLDTSVVSDLLDSDRFTADVQQLTEIPVNNRLGSQVLCSADEDDNSVLVQGRAIDKATADIEADKANDEETRYEYRGGFGYRRDNAIVWTCGNVTASISVRETPEDLPDWEQLAEPMWDKIGCMTIASDGSASQPEGWR